MSDVLAVLAAEERTHPGKLASWLRAQPPEKPRQERAFFCKMVDLKNR
jgi:hypothetical protein